MTLDFVHNSSFLSSYMSCVRKKKVHFLLECNRARAADTTRASEAHRTVPSSNCSAPPSSLRLSRTYTGAPASARETDCLHRCAPLAHTLAHAERHEYRHNQVQFIGLTRREKKQWRENSL